MRGSANYLTFQRAFASSLPCLAFVLALSSVCWSQDVADTPMVGGKAPSAEQIEAWVKELDDDRFVARRNATDRLILAGVGAIEPVAKAVQSGNLEVSTRGIHVLRELALSMDIAAQETALEALQQLAESPRRSAARSAQKAIVAMGDVRQERAIKQMEQLGAKITTMDRSNGFQRVRHLVVEIGPTWEGTLADLQRLKWLRDVKEIAIVGERFTDAWIEPVANLARVDHVVIKYANISDSSLRILSQLKNVTQVDLMYTPVTDAGLEHLKKLKSVRLIRCYGTRITKLAVDRFQNEVANVEVDHKLGAFLGVVCQQAPWPCVVMQVKPDSAALRGGLRMHDIIVRYDGQPVTNFDALRQLIGRNKVGESVVIQVARGSTDQRPDSSPVRASTGIGRRIDVVRLPSQEGGIQLSGGQGGSSCR